MIINLDKYNRAVSVSRISLMHLYYKCSVLDKRIPSQNRPAIDFNSAREIKRSTILH